MGTSLPSIRFVGPAGQEFKSFQELSKSSLDENLPGWIDTSTYIIPHVFFFKRANHNDEDFHKEVENRQRSRLVTARRSDDAEYLVYEALSQLARDRFQAPFIAVHNLNIDRIKYNLSAILNFEGDPSQEFVKCMREYDYVIIGPKIGLVIIEVKHSYFERERDFSNTNAHLPDDYKKAIIQLNSIHTLVQLLERCTECAWPEEIIPIRKILFTPNLNQKRYKDWLDNLTDTKRGRVTAKLSGIVQWFNEHTSDLYQHLKDFLQMPLVNTVISTQIYPLYAPIIVGLSSLVINKKEANHIGLKTVQISMAEAIEDVSARLQSQDFLGGLHRDPVQAPSGHKLIRDEAIILTPDQLAVLGSQCRRQLIFGPAGAGKTIILQQKALELLGKGKSVLVLAPESTLNLYRKLFEAHELTNYGGRNWLEVTELMQKFYVIFNAEEQSTLEAQYDAFCKMEWPREIRDFLDKYEVLIVDDALDVRTQDMYYFTFIPILAAYAIARKEMVVWIGVDNYHELLLQKEPFYGRPFNGLLDSWLLPHPRGQDCNSRYCTVVLRQVMRCAQHVFSQAYKFDKHIETIPDIFRPVLGHKVIGLDSTTTNKQLSDYIQAMEEIKRDIASQVDKLTEQRLPKKCIAVICSDAEILNEIQKPPLQLSLQHMHMCTWSDVSSLEWPVVIFVNVDQPTKLDFLKSEKIYRARSRATTKLIELNYNIYDGKSPRWITGSPFTIISGSNEPQ